MSTQQSSGHPATRLDFQETDGNRDLMSLVREHDWSATPLGDAKNWPQSLRTVIDIMLTSRYAMWMGWGEQLTFLYNDAYRPTLGIKHPWALGSAAREVWAEIWPDIGPRIDTVLTTGKATYDEGLQLFLKRSGFPEETYHTFSYSPLSGDDGRVAGMLCVVTEETDRIIGARRMAFLHKLASGLASCNTEEEVLAAIERHAGLNTHDLPFSLLYLFDSDGSGQAQLACAAGIERGHAAAPTAIPPETAESVWPAAEIFKEATSRVDNLAGRLSHVRLPTGAWDRPPEMAAVVPIRQQGQERPAGFLVAAVNPYRRYDSAYSGFIDLLAGQLTAGLANARAYEEERRRTQALAELDRAKTAFFSNVSHEFRTPLTLMLAPLEDLMDRSRQESSSADRETLAIVHRNGLRLQKLVNTLLDFSRIEAGRMQATFEPTDLGALTAELASVFRAAMERAGLRFTIDCRPLPQPVYVDCEMWEKIVLNLLSNAFKYTLQGSVTVSLTDRGDFAELSVADTGTGIPEKELPDIFKRFHRIEGSRGRTHEGTGIGLALVQELVKLHGGTVSVTSTVDRGSTFTVILPFGARHLPQDRIGTHRSAESATLRADTYLQEALRWLPPEKRKDAPEAPDLGAVCETQPHSKRGHVLLADDNADMREYVRRLLSADFRVTAAENGEEALACALADLPDLVLTDVMMPGLDGFGLLHRLRAHPATSSIPVVMLSARAGEEASIQGLELGADDYLVKPFTARELLARVRAHLALKRERQATQERLTRIFSQAPVAICVLRGPQLIVDLANSTCRDLLPGREIVGRGLAEVIPASANSHVLRSLKAMLESGEIFEARELSVVYDRDRDGVPEDHWFNLVAHPLYEANESISGIIAVASEVTAQVLSREQLLKANRELEEFTYVASHDLQEPLRTVSIYTRLLLERCSPNMDAEAAEYAGFVSAGAKRMELLVQDLLSYSRVIHSEQEPPQLADLNKALEDALKMLYGSLQETGAVIAHETMPKVWADEKQLTQVFQNLLSNALKYRREGEPPRVHIGAKRSRGDWVVSVQDNGIGFAPRHAGRIFGLFKRLHRDQYPGTGLGLAICKRIIERYGGRIWALSEGEGQGATFCFKLRGEAR